MSILTVRALREMIADLPDETPVILAVRCDQNEDYFHDALPVEGFSLGVDDPDHEPILTVGEWSGERTDTWASWHTCARSA